MHRGIVLELGITAEHEPDVRVDRQCQVREAAPTLRLHLPANMPLPEIPTHPTRLNSAVDLHRSIERQAESVENWIILRQRPRGGHRPVFQIPEIDLKHSPGS